MKKKKLLVCGATGFIGRNIIETLVDRDDLELVGTYLNSRPVDNTKFKMIQADLTNKEDVNRATEGMDIIIQAAATTSGAKDIVTKPYHHVTDNAVMNSLIFRSAYEKQVSQVIFFSCTVMYQSSDMPVKETDFDANKEIFPNYFGVGWTKVYIEKMCEFYSKLGQTKYTAIRHSNIYGPHDKFDLERSHVFGATMTKVMTNNDGRIVVWGPGTEKRDLLYIGDLVDFTVKTIEKQKSPFELVNVGFGKAISIKELVHKIIECSGKEISVEHDLSQPHIPTSLSLDITKAKEIFSWEPLVSLEDGIKKTMEWYRREIDG